jgi:hypothetical protein
LKGALSKVVGAIDSVVLAVSISPRASAEYPMFEKVAIPFTGAASGIGSFTKMPPEEVKLTAVVTEVSMFPFSSTYPT